MEREGLRLYAVLRSDIRMSSGKAIAQAGHAYLQTMIETLAAGDPRAMAYAGLAPGTKIALDGGSLENLLTLRDWLAGRGVPHAVITDQGHVEPPDFDGSDVVTALGVGPVTRLEARRLRLLARLPLWGAPRKGGAP